jgi:hypothetical protein
MYGVLRAILKLGRGVELHQVGSKCSSHRSPRVSDGITVLKHMTWTPGTRLLLLRDDGVVRAWNRLAIFLGGVLIGTEGFLVLN